MSDLVVIKEEELSDGSDTGSMNVVEIPEAVYIKEELPDYTDEELPIKTEVFDYEEISRNDESEGDSIIKFEPSFELDVHYIGDERINKTDDMIIDNNDTQRYESEDLLTCYYCKFKGCRSALLTHMRVHYIGEETAIDNELNNIDEGSNISSLSSEKNQEINELRYRETFESINENNINKSEIDFNKYVKVELNSSCDEQQFVCKFCDYRSWKRLQFKEHLAKHNAATLNIFKCKFCNYKTKLSICLKKHIETHSNIHNSLLFVCNVCKYSTENYRDYERHKIDIHAGNKRPYSCDICLYVTRFRSRFLYHMQVHSGEKPFICYICNYRARLRQQMICHMRIHTGEKPFKCDQCNYRARRKQLLVFHRRTHTGDKPYKCDYCDYTASRKLQLECHTRIHTGEKPFICYVCNYRSARKTCLKTHIVLKHIKNEKIFPCSVCNFKTTRYAELKKHMASHTADKPFQCTLCAYKTKEASQLKRHQSIHSNGTLFPFSL